VKHPLALPLGFPFLASPVRDLSVPLSLFSCSSVCPSVEEGVSVHKDVFRPAFLEGSTQWIERIWEFETPGFKHHPACTNHRDVTSFKHYEP
jgi:hypothetical protein